MPATSTTDLTYAPKSGILRTLETDRQQEYAEAANSRNLPPWAQRVIDDAARGREFDVWIFHQALTQALSACATRDGQSTARRLRSRKVRHLAYWSAAIIEKTLVGMEPVEGRTSPALQAARDQLDAANSMVYEAAEKLDQANERIGALIREKTEAEAEVYFLQEAIGYVRRIMPPGLVMQMNGYMDRLREEG